jgi:transposase
MMSKSKLPSSQAIKALPAQFDQLHLNAAGIDIGSEFHFVAVPADRDERPVRKFGAFTVDLIALADWLRRCAVDTVVMESTGVYWIPLFELLESRGFEVMLVDPRRLKTVPGRKTDVLDCQWLQQLHAFGLLSGAFRPVEQVCVLRAYMRQRAMLVEYASHHIQHMQKALHQMNVKLDKVISDITGLTGTAIINAILDGERDPMRLANLRDRRCKNPTETIAKALRGNWRDEHLFALRQAAALHKMYKQQLEECDRRIEAHLGTFEDKGGDQPPSTRRQSPKPNRNALHFDAKSQLLRITGVDLTRIDGLDGHTVLKVISEIGTDMCRWPSVKHFTSWLSLSPGNKQSGGKVLSGRTKPSGNRAAAALRMAAQSLHSSKTALGAYYRRMRARLGGPKAVTATAHKLARLVYYSLKGDWEYKDPGQNWYEQQYQDRVLQFLRRRASELGYTLVAANPQPSSS